nr:transglycosylase SLT domain-containing protein [Sulfitobacter sabulilitoris]
MTCCLAFVLGLNWPLAVYPATAATDPAAICDDAAQRASRESGVPLTVLRAITRTETGRRHHGKLQPWAWTVNMEGTGVWFDDEFAARAYVFKHFKRGARSFDIGCFQINYKWHSQAFASIEEMFDPIPNARYAAKFLTTLYDELGDWSKAAGAYHSRTEKYAQTYIARFDAIRAALPKGDTHRPEQVEPARQGRDRNGPANSFPLLRRQNTLPRMGSLVPLGSTGQGSLLSRSGSGLGG